MHQTCTLHFAKPLQYHSEYLRPQRLSVFSRCLAFFLIQLLSALVLVGTRSTTEPTTDNFVRGLHKSWNPWLSRFEKSYELFEAIQEIIKGIDGTKITIKAEHFDASLLNDGSKEPCGLRQHIFPFPISTRRLFMQLVSQFCCDKSSLDTSFVTIVLSTKNYHFPKISNRDSRIKIRELQIHK